MNEPSKETFADLRRSWPTKERSASASCLLIVPFVITAVLTAMFFFLSARLTNVEVLTRRIDIDRYLQQESNYAWAVKEYEDIAKVHPSARIMARLGLL